MRFEHELDSGFPTSTTLKNAACKGGIFYGDRTLREPNLRDAGRVGNSRRMRRACERIRACKREDREIPAASTKIKNATRFWYGHKTSVVQAFQ